MTGKTLKELNVQPGDVVELTESKERYVIGENPYKTLGHVKLVRGFLHDWHIVTIVSRAVDTPKLWRDMTPEEKGALLLAHHEGEVIEFWDGGDEWNEIKPRWHHVHAYRIRPEPKVEVVTFEHAGCRFTFDTIDGKPDCDSVKMEEL